MSNSECQQPKYKPKPGEWAISIKPNMLCAYTKGQDVCQSDSGGPLIAQVLALLCLDD